MAKTWWNSHKVFSEPFTNIRWTATQSAPKTEGTRKGEGLQMARRAISTASQRGLLEGYNSLEGHTWPGILSALQIPVVSPVSRTKTSVESLIGGWHYASRHCYGW